MPDESGDYLVHRARGSRKAVSGRSRASRETNLNELTARADCILVGEITDVACYRADKDNIYTLVTLPVEQTIKGQAQQEVVIRILGGELNGPTL